MLRRAVASSPPVRLRGRAGAHQSCVTGRFGRNIVKLCCQAIGALAACRVHATASGGAPANGLVDGQLRMLKTRLDGYARRPRPPER